MRGILRKTGRALGPLYIELNLLGNKPSRSDANLKWPFVGWNPYNGDSWLPVYGRPVKKLVRRLLGEINREYQRRAGELEYEALASRARAAKVSDKADGSPRNMPGEGHRGFESGQSTPPLTIAVPAASPLSPGAQVGHSKSTLTSPDGTPSSALTSARASPELSTEQPAGAQKRPAGSKLSPTLARVLEESRQQRWTS